MTHMASSEPETWVFPPRGAITIPWSASAAFGPVHSGDTIELVWAPADQQPDIIFTIAPTWFSPSLPSSLPPASSVRASDSQRDPREQEVPSLFTRPSARRLHPRPIHDHRERRAPALPLYLRAEGAARHPRERHHARVAPIRRELRIRPHRRLRIRLCARQHVAAVAAGRPHRLGAQSHHGDGDGDGDRGGLTGARRKRRRRRHGERGTLSGRRGGRWCRGHSGGGGEYRVARVGGAPQAQEHENGHAQARGAGNGPEKHS